MVRTPTPTIIQKGKLVFQLIDLGIIAKKTKKKKILSMVLQKIIVF